MKFNTLEQGQMFLSKQMNLEDQIALQPERYVAGWEEAKGLKGTFIQINERVQEAVQQSPFPLNLEHYVLFPCLVTHLDHWIKIHNMESARTYNDFAFNILGLVIFYLTSPLVNG
ncbi:hypothetical protein TB2_019047 [Malus domestica]